MPQIIAGTYEIIREIGSGGGGVVYLAKHLRLDKQVVVKADKRRISAKPESLRREVDALKNLSHTYIPQVYDFVQENETVYTVMDYIEGESLDKPLKRNETASQAQIIEWACQLLDALNYLHSRPPHGILHADLKPANIMLTPDGTVRLIDYNIALALGEDGAVSVGRSLGYASPEHLGLDFSPSGATTRNTSGARATTVLDSPETVLESTPQPSSSGTSGKKIMLDVRSDIYGLGATLYHLLTGKRPANHVKDVVPLSDKDYSYGIAAIINKAMNPNPEMRYQTAAEMLYAFEHLRESDPRTIRFKRLRNISVLVCLGLLLLGSITAFTGLKRLQDEQAVIAIQESERAEAEKARAETERVRAEEEQARANAEELAKEIEQAKNNASLSEKALINGDRQGAVKFALDAMPGEGDLYVLSDVPEAQLALSNALGVYDLSDGFKHHRAITLSTEILKIALSPDGKTAAAVTLGTLTIFSTEDATQIETLDTVDSALADVEFVNDVTLVYAGRNGISLYDIAANKVLWTGKTVTEITVSADKQTFAAVYKDEKYATVYDSAGKQIGTVDFGGKSQRVTVNDSFANPEDNLLALNHDGTWLAVSFGDGALVLYDLGDPNNKVEIFDESEFFHFEGGFSGDFFAFSSTGKESSVFAVIDMRYLEQTGGFESDKPFGVITNESGVYISNEDVVVKINPVTGVQEEVAYTTNNVLSFAVGSGNTIVGVVDSSFAFFDSKARPMNQYSTAFKPDFVAVNGDYALVGSRNTPTIRILKQKDYQSFFEYDTEYFHDEARLNADGTTVMLFSFDGFKLFDVSGKLIKEIELPDAKQIYDQQYRRDETGSRLEVVYNDGKTDFYSGDTGELIGSEQREKPDLSLYEEFFTDTLRITSPLHGAPIAYDKNTGEQIKELEKDAYLTYVTQVGDYVMTEYVATDDTRYGLLIDSKTCATLAYLPNLCDIIGERLIFDINSGYLRETRLYHTSELTAQTNY